METTTLGAIFVGAFAISCAILFAGYIGTFVRWLSGRPRQENIILGADMRGRKAIIEEISPNGQSMMVKVGTEYWRADLHKAKNTQPLGVGDNVHIIGMNGLTLKVQPPR